MNANLLSRLFIAWLTCLAALLFAPILLAAEAEKAPPVATEDNTLSITSTICCSHGKAICPA